MTIYVVQSGETIDTIAANYGVNPARLAADNEVPASGALAVGQTLVIRSPRQVHAVHSGETMGSIAAAYGISVRTKKSVPAYSTAMPIPTSPRPCWRPSFPMSPISPRSPTASPLMEPFSP